MNKPMRINSRHPLRLQMICPNTYTDVLLAESKFGLSAAQFAALAFLGQPLVHPGIGRCDVSFTLHEGWVQMTLYCRGECAGLAALGWDQNGNMKATKFMANMAAVTGWDEPWPATRNSKAPHLLAFFDAPFLKRSGTDEVNLALNALAVAGFGLMQHVRADLRGVGKTVPLQLPEIRLLMASQSELAASKKTGPDKKRSPKSTAEKICTTI